MRKGVRATFPPATASIRKLALTPFLFLAIHAHARILDVHTDIRVAKGGELTVTERITLEVGATEKRAGLERVLQGPLGVVGVSRNGQPEPYTLDHARLRVGRGDLPPGRHLYQIAYRSSRGIGFLDGGYDELRWKLAGAERMTAEVTLPVPVPARDIRARVETSAPSTQGGEVQSFVRDGRAAFRSADAVTIVVRFPKDVVAAPGLAERARWLFDDYKGLLGVFLLLSLAAGVLAGLKKQAGF